MEGGITTRDYYKGYLEYEELDSCLQDSLLGLCILKQNDNYINAVPTKLYEYLINGVPHLFCHKLKRSLKAMKV